MRQADRTRGPTSTAVRRRAVWAAWLLVALCPSARADELLAARAALSDGLYKVAQRQLERHLEKYSESPGHSVPALLLLCRTLDAQGRSAEVLQALDARPAVVAAGRAGGGFDFWRAKALLEQNRPLEALAVIEARDPDRLEPIHADGLRRLAGRAQVSLGKIDAARKSFAALDKASTNLATRSLNLLEWARAELLANRPETALGLLRRQVGEIPLQAHRGAYEEGLQLQAELLLTQGHTNAAHELLLSQATNGLFTARHRATAWVTLAELAAARGREQELRQAGPRALELPLTPDESWRLGMRFARAQLRLTGQLSYGASRLKQLIRARPGAPESAAAQVEMARAWLTAGSNRQAVVEFRLYLETYDDPAWRPMALAGLGTGLFRMGNHLEAATTFRKAAEVYDENDPMRAECLLQAGNALHAAEHYENASELFRRVAQLGADAIHRQAAFLQADALERFGSFEAAERAFAALAESMDANEASTARLRLAALRERRLAIEEATDVYNQVIDTTTNRIHRAQAFLGRGRLHHRAYRFEAAIEDFVQAGNLHSNVAAEAEYHRVMSMYGAGRDEDAWQLAQQFANRHPRAPQQADVALWMAKFSYNRHDFADAQQRFIAFAERWPTNEWADESLLWAGRAAFRRSEFPAAIETMARLVQDFPHSPLLAEARFVQADALDELARFEEAIMVLEEIVNRYPESEWVTPAWIRKGDCLLALGSETVDRYEQALQAYAVAAARPDVTPEQVYQTKYKTARCLEKLRRKDEALETYYELIVHFRRERVAGVWHSLATQTWFARAAARAADLLEAQGERSAAIRVLRHVVQTGAPGMEDARARIERLRTAGVDTPRTEPSSADRMTAEEP